MSFVYATGKSGSTGTKQTGLALFLVTGIWNSLMTIGKVESSLLLSIHILIACFFVVVVNFTIS